jgi:hypothetical protein
MHNSGEQYSLLFLGIFFDRSRSWNERRPRFLELSLELVPRAFFVFSAQMPCSIASNPALDFGAGRAPIAYSNRYIIVFFFWPSFLLRTEYFIVARHSFAVKYLLFGRISLHICNKYYIICLEYEAMFLPLTYTALQTSGPHSPVTVMRTSNLTRTTGKDRTYENDTYWKRHFY